MPSAKKLTPEKSEARFQFLEKRNQQLEAVLRFPMVEVPIELSSVDLPVPPPAPV